MLIKLLKNSIHYVIIKQHSHSKVKCSIKNKLDGLKNRQPKNEGVRLIEIESIKKKNIC